MRTEHAYNKLNSVDNALHAVVRWLKGALLNKEYAVGTFLYTEEALNNVPPEAVIRVLDKFVVESNLPLRQNIVAHGRAGKLPNERIGGTQLVG